MNQQMGYPRQSKLRLVSTTYIYDREVALPARGTRLDGGGVVTDVGERRVTVEYAAPSEPIYLEAKGVKTTIINKWGPDEGGVEVGHFSAGFGAFHIGQLVDGGGGATGTVTAVTGTEVTISFPNGVPSGPITLPGVDTTVVEETASTDPEGRDGEVHVGSPFGLEPELSPVFVDEAAGVRIGTEVEGIRTRFELRKPGTKANAVRIEPQVLEKPRNDSTCSCAVFIGSFDASGTLLDAHATELAPGEMILEYRPQPGAVSIRFVCSSNCPNSDCSCSISIKSALVG